MTLLKKLVASTSLVVLLTASASVTAFAHNSSDDKSETHSGTSRTVVTENKVTTRTASSDDTQPDDKVKADFQNRAKQRVEELKKAGQQKTKAARETACTSHKTGAEQRIQSISKNTAGFQTKLNNIFEKAKAYKTEKDLRVANYDSLVAAVDAAQAASATSQATLNSLKPTIDCTKDTNAQDVAAFRTATQDARDKLKTYMQSLKELLKAISEAKQAVNTSTDGSTN